MDSGNSVYHVDSVDCGGSVISGDSVIVDCGDSVDSGDGGDGGDAGGWCTHHYCHSL